MTQRNKVFRFGRFRLTLTRGKDTAHWCSGMICMETKAFREWKQRAQKTTAVKKRALTYSIIKKGVTVVALGMILGQIIRIYVG